MKRSLLTLVVLAVCAGFASADYVDPPGWENNPYFTHQSWEFSTGANPAVPETWLNPNGQPVCQISGMTYIGDAWMLEGPRQMDPGAPALALRIPNEPNPDLYKEIWFQITFQTNKPDLFDNVALAPLDPAGNIGTWQWDKTEYLDAMGNIRYTAIWVIDPQPAYEDIILDANLNAGEFVILKEFDVDTRCIPEPLTLSMLALGAIGIIRRKR